MCIVCVCVCVCVCMNIFLIYLAFDRNLVGFHTLAIWVMLQWTWKYRYLCKIIFQFPLGIYQEVGLLDLMVVLFLIFWGISVLFSIVTVLVYIPTNSVPGFPFLYILANIYLLYFYNSYPNRYEAISYCGFNLCFPDD